MRSSLDYWAASWHLSTHEIVVHIRPSLNATRIPATVVRRRVVRACHARQYRATEPMRRGAIGVTNPDRIPKIQTLSRSARERVFCCHQGVLAIDMACPWKPGLERRKRGPQRHSFVIYGRRALGCRRSLQDRVSAEFNSRAVHQLRGTNSRPSSSGKTRVCQSRNAVSITAGRSNSPNPGGVGSGERVRLISARERPDGLQRDGS